jgi:hypothetical protein
MASHSTPAHRVHQANHAAPYCNDPDCAYCNELRDFQDRIRVHEFTQRTAPDGNVPKKDVGKQDVPKKAAPENDRPEQHAPGNL